LFGGENSRGFFAEKNKLGLGVNVRTRKMHIALAIYAARLQQGAQLHLERAGLLPNKPRDTQSLGFCHWREVRTKLI
jgi:hypothetical protein